MRSLNKKGALELSVSTIVVVVLAMSMLILGLVLVRNIFTGAIHNVDTINDKVKGELNQLFTDDGQKVAIFLPDNTAKVKLGEEAFGVAFAIKNTERGEINSINFNYEVSVGEIEQSCSSLSEAEAEAYISIGKKDSFALPPGGTAERIIKIRPSGSAPLCEIRYDIDIFKGTNQPYESTYFFVQITS